MTDKRTSLKPPIFQKNLYEQLWHTHISETGLLNHITVAFDRLKLVASLGNIVFELLAVLLTRLVKFLF